MRTNRATGAENALDDYRAFARSGVKRPEPPPANSDAWARRLADTHAQLERALGRMPDEPCGLAPEILGTLHRDGYAIERLTFQSRPGVRVTANLYRPEPLEGRAPAVLSVHGHASWARIDPDIQRRCIGLARLGYVVLSVDAFGAGERAIEPRAGSYHGGLVGASLWPLGTPLLGLQVYDNRRAVDYLVSRPEVDAGKLAITGASGGGNQSLYAGALDERFRAVVPVCGAGTYESYIGAACCVCEVNPGGAAKITTGEILALVAPRALMVVSATRDAVQFSVAEAAKSVAFARERYKSLGLDERIRHVAVEAGHSYNQAMREAMYGWAEKWLGGRGDGRPIAEPAIAVEDIETLRCFPTGTNRPRSVATIPEFAAREGARRLSALPAAPDHRERWEADRLRMRHQLREDVLKISAERGPWELKAERAQNEDGAAAAVNVGALLTVAMERGIVARGQARFGPKPRGTALVLSYGPGPNGEWDEATRRELDQVLDRERAAGRATLELSGFRATGRWLKGAHPVAGVLDHTPAEWGLWIGRPLLGQWVGDVLRWLDLLDGLGTKAAPRPEWLASPSRPYRLIGVGPMGLPALLAAALDERVESVACTELLASFVGRGPNPWSKMPMGPIAPNILDVGDVGHLAALVAPRPLTIARGHGPDDVAMSRGRLNEAFSFAQAVYRLLGRPENLRLGAGPGDE